jgi:hypothetical protein
VASEQHEEGDTRRDVNEREISGQQMKRKRKERKNEPSVFIGRGCCAGRALFGLRRHDQATHKR